MQLHEKSEITGENGGEFSKFSKTTFRLSVLA